MDEKTIPLSKLPVDIKVQVSGSNTLGTNLDYRALFEQTGESVFIIGLDFKFITANQQALRLLGYDESQLIGMPVEEIMPLEDPGERDALIEKHLTVSESTLKKKDGRAIPVELSISVVHNGLGMPAYIQLLARDISERKQSQLALKRHMRALSVIGEATAGLFRSPSIEATIPEVLGSLAYAMDVFCCALFNIHVPTMKVQYQWLSPDAAGFDVSAALTPFLEIIAENPTRVFSITDVPLPNPNIPLISLIVIPIQGAMGSLGFLVLIDKENHLSWLANEFDSIQTIANLIGAALDRVRYERTIQLNEMRNRVIVDALPDLLMRIDLTGRILDYNASSNHPLYMPRLSTVGKKLQDLWSPEVAKMIIETEAQDAFISSHWVYGFSLPNHEQTFEARLHPISADEALVIVRDITEQARLDQMKSDFINRASHELRTPLTAAIMMAELLQQGGTKEETDEYWRVLMGELNRQKDLINQLLLAGRLESGKMHLDAVPLDLMPVLNESIQAVKVIASKHNIPIEVCAEVDSLSILGDKGGLSQVFINLINNAVKFSPEGKAVEVTVNKGTEYVSIGIVDHGLGIPPDAIPHLFERFYRAKNVTVAEIPGSGIGLYIVKSIIDELGGSIAVESEINHGTKFTVRLRRAA
jgi:PAS domain S-box-containing protein